MDWGGQAPYYHILTPSPLHLFVTACTRQCRWWYSRPQLLGEGEKARYSPQSTSLPPNQFLYCFYFYISSFVSLFLSVFFSLLFVCSVVAPVNLPKYAPLSAHPKPEGNHSSPYSLITLTHHRRHSSPSSLITIVTHHRRCYWLVNPRSSLSGRSHGKLDNILM